MILLFNLCSNNDFLVSFSDNTENHLGVKRVLNGNQYPNNCLSCCVNDVNEPVVDTSLWWTSERL